MSTAPHTPATEATAPALHAPAVWPAPVALSASERLALSRAQLASWLDHDRATRAAPGAGWEALAALPVLNRWRHHPLAVLALGALARAWLRPAPGGTAPALQVLVLGTAASVLRRHPKTVLVAAALAVTTVFWARWRQRTPPSSPPT
ncbi:MAG: hypothetical protein Q8K50_04355 [Hydrogenophaga sp.]|nr:hypothetical protein [Hydrogenophaga sp.]